MIGKVGSIITQGVYSVATPFHPFGGAVDVIVVQQQDGTFRSTPWYVRFGKFQGVLKGAEKFVRINVNGIDANFHMCLDNSGEAYFIKEVDPGKGDETSGAVKDSDNLTREDSDGQSTGNKNILDLPRLEHSVSDSAMDQLHECGSMAPDRIDRAESDIDRRFYEFQDDQSSLEGSAELPVSEYGSSRYDNLDNELLGESHSNSEVILVSVDGHVLTAPISASEQNAENLQLDTPRFNLGPGEETDFCEGNEELGTGESAWAADYISKLEASRTSVAVGNGNVCSIQNDKNDISLQVQVCEGKGECACEAQETEKTSCQGDPQMHTNAEEDASAKKAVLSKNCSEVVELAKLAEKTDVEDEGSSLEAHISPEKCHQTLDNGVAELKKNREFSASSGSVLLDNSLSQDLQVEHASAKKAEFFKSSSELVDVAELAENAEKANIEDEGSSSKAQISPEKCLQNLDTGVVELEKNNEISDSSRSVLPDNDLSSDLHVGDEPTPEIASCDSVDSISVHSDLPGNNLSPDLQVGNEPVEEMASFASIDSTSVQSFSNDSERKDEQVGTDSISVHSVSFDLERKEEQMDTDSISGHCVSNVASAAVEGTESSQEIPASDGECSKSEPLEPETASPSEVTQVHSSIRFEISLCGNELRAGMGMTAAAEAFDARRISSEEFKTSATSILKNENLIIRCRDRYFSWDKAAPVVLGMAAFGLDVPIETKDAIPVERDDTEKPSTPSGRRWRLWPIPFRRVKTLEHTSSNSSNEEEFVDSESNLLNSQGEATPESPQKKVSPQKQILRTNVPTTEQIASLNLKEGQNVITFSFSTRVLGTQQVDAHIYLWKWNARIVISDVDGTITKSDVLGQFMPLVGKDWTQSGVARLFSAIKENGYQLLFLSARAIIQAYLTRSFLNNLKQDGKALPSGPVVISPDGLFPSLYREVVRRAPHEFKIACLEDIKKLFPEDYNPFYAGFGNRDTDELSYRKIGIPKGKIFIINPKGEVAISHHRAADVKSYTSLHTLVNDMFPPTSLVEQEDFNSWNYWKLPLPEVDI